eukprot:10844727-Alexandrium_andersonii.AAC.1
MHRGSRTVGESARIATGRKLRPQRRPSPRHAGHAAVLGLSTRCTPHRYPSPSAGSACSAT